MIKIEINGFGRIEITDTFVKVISWYDNEYSTKIADLLEYSASL